MRFDDCPVPEHLAFEQDGYLAGEADVFLVLRVPGSCNIIKPPKRIR